MRDEKVREIKVWQLVKEIEENKETDSRILGEIKATLLVNFGENGRVKGIIRQSQTPLQMLVVVLQYLMDNNKPVIDEGKLAEMIIDKMDWKLIGGEFSNQAIEDLTRTISERKEEWLR